ncbi:MAG: DNA cytosine methyltransferase [Bacteroidota bacterium]
MRVLIACEESQAVCTAFRKVGHEAYSCDLKPCSGGHPEWHYQQDVTELLKEKWDLIIAHPTCTYLSNAGAARLYPIKGIIDQHRFEKGLQAKKFFMLFYNSSCPRVCIENPIPSTIYDLPKYDQMIQPYEYGHAYSKKTCLWLKGLPVLEPTKIIKENVISWVSGGSKDHKGNPRKRKATNHRSSETRSKTFAGVAQAMADQWGIY